MDLSGLGIDVKLKERRKERSILAHLAEKESGAVLV